MVDEKKALQDRKWTGSLLGVFESGDRAEFDNPEPVARGTRSAGRKPLAEALTDKGVEGGGGGGAKKTRGRTERRGGRGGAERSKEEGEGEGPEKEGGRGPLRKD